MPAPRFSSKTLAFLRALARNNDRQWFRAHKDEYQTHVREPMLAVIEQLAVDLRAFAPELTADPRRSIYRVYRDTRFSEDKSPLKTNIAAVFPPRDGERHQSAGLYLEIAPKYVWIGGGLYAPDSAALRRVREHIAANLTAFRSIVTSPEFRKQCGTLEGERLQRVPRGFPQDHPAAEFLVYKQWLAMKELPPAFACSPRFYRGTLDVFRAIAPLVRFLNDGLRGGFSTGSTLSSAHRGPREQPGDRRSALRQGAQD
jgi:uncharacterized protein (TIGR02453 family)